MPKSSRGDASNVFFLDKSLWEGCLLSWSTWWPCSNISSLQTLYDTELVTSITEAEAQMLRITGCHSWWRGLSSPSIWFYTWGYWSSERPKDFFEVTELLSGRAGSRKPTSWSPRLQLLLPLHSHPPWTRSISDGNSEPKQAQTMFKTLPSSLPPILK